MEINTDINKLDENKLDDLDSEADIEEPEQVEKEEEQTEATEQLTYEDGSFKLALSSSTESMPNLISWLDYIKNNIVKNGNNKNQKYTG